MKVINIFSFDIRVTEKVPGKNASIFSRVTWQTFGIVKARFNIDRHVHCFLKGYGRPARD